MQIGDPKKALVLAIVAIVVIGIAAFQLFPKAQHLATALRNESQGTAVTVVTPKPDNRALPTVLTSSPFDKPEVKKPNPGKPKGDAASGSGQAGSGEAAGGNPNGGPSLANPDIKKDHLPLPLVLNLSPDENTGASQQPIVVPPKGATLQAILRVHRRVAIFALRKTEDDGRTEFQVGSKLGDYTITEMSDTMLILQPKKGKPVKLHVGEDLRL